MRFTRWDQVVDTETTNALLQELCNWHLSQCASTVSAATEIRELLARGDLRGLCDYELDYTGLTASDARDLRQTLAFFSKRADLDIGVDKEAVAWDKFQSAERLCAQTNDVFRQWSLGKFQFHPDVESVLHRAQRKIATVLGDVPSLSELNVRFGPGATTSITKRDASARAKLGQRFACSEDLLGIVGLCLEEMPAWIPFGDSDTAIVEVDIHHGRLSFVPKTAKTHRAIVVEPMLNSMFQLGIGDFLTQRLKSVGVDLSDQTRNQRLALEGSLTGELATLDLSSASDTVARELVYHLLPIDWALFLDRFRTSTVEYKGHVIKLQKFSSMGNGFTFPLESLIFWALASSCTKGASNDKQQTCVYGDDIIVPAYAYELLSDVLTAVGFVLNPSKSFASGPFRESCGKDYLSGIDIRPCYVKDVLSGADVFVLHNFYVRTLQPEPAAVVLQWISEPLRIWGPDGYGDGHLLGEWQPRPHRRATTGSLAEPGGWGGWLFDTYTWKGRKSFKPYPGDGVLPAYSTYVSSLGRVEGPGTVTQRPIELPPLIRELALKGLRVKDSPGPVYDRAGRLGVTLPGRKGYKRVSIYTLSPE